MLRLGNRGYTPIPKEALVVNIGHSLGASVAVRTYLTQQEMGYENAYVIGYNGGAISDPVSDEILQHAIEHVVFVHNRRDWVIPDTLGAGAARQARVLARLSRAPERNVRGYLSTGAQRKRSKNPRSAGVLVR